MLGLRALLEEALGRGDKALAALREAVSVSEPGGAVRLLADLGPGLAGILNRLDVQGDELNPRGIDPGGDRRTVGERGLRSR